jgi:hypothetical protein
MVTTPGVANSSSRPRRARRRGPSARARWWPSRGWPRSRSPRSRSTSSSPISAGTMNSCEKLPPMTPVSASTAMAVTPMRAEELLVGRLHREVALHRGLVVGVEGIGVHHDELAGAHQAEARADLVPELGGDLVEILRQVAVAGDLGLHQRGDDFLMGRPEHEFRLLRAALAGTGVVHAIHDLAGAAQRGPAPSSAGWTCGIQSSMPPSRSSSSRQSCVSFCMTRRPSGM